MVNVISEYQGLLNTVEGTVEEVQEMYRKMFPVTFSDLVFEEVK